MIFSNQTSKHQAPASIILLLPLRVSLCQFNSEVEQNLKHNVSAGRSWGEHNVSKSGKKKLKTQSLTCSRARMGAQAQEEQTIVRKLGKVEQPGAAYERKKREHKKYQRGQKCSCIIFCVLGLFFRSG